MPLEGIRYRFQEGFFIFLPFLLSHAKLIPPFSRSSQENWLDRSPREAFSRNLHEFYLGVDLRTHEPPRLTRGVGVIRLFRPRTTGESTSVRKRTKIF
ncbi:hypothetical protein TNCT_496461 [Trichonephila clavata]|uniref:Uncharacterized protein n=1 Tax=Trichonephila clavata TaxID=2740835 RepID=A0A8X6FYS5_TRICU|nr:hypothetical protein TNCT_496461 [Trichonephila clavata]